MRLGYITYGLDRRPTGLGRYALALLEALAVLPGAPEIVLLTTERRDPHGLWRRFAHHPLPGGPRLPGLLTGGDLALGGLARRLRLDLVHDPNGFAPFLGPAGGTRRVVTIHDASPLLLPDRHSRLDAWRYRWHLPRAARRADAVLTDSHAARRDLVARLGLDSARLHAVPLGVAARFRPVADGPARRAALARAGVRPPYLLYVGGLNGRKNLERLLAAFAAVRPRQPGLTLVLAGPRQWRTARFDAALARLDLARHVHLTGYVADADLPALYSGAAAFVYPSLHEGFGLPPLEALACGAPVVTSTAGALPEVVGDAALTVPPTDTDALAAAIEQLLTDAPLRARLRARGLARAARFTWAYTARATLAVYEQALAARPAGRSP